MFAPKGSFGSPRPSGIFGSILRTDHDDEDDRVDHPSNGWKHALKIAILTAGLTTIAEKAGEWMVDELRSRFGTPEKPTKPKPKPATPEKPAP